MLLAYKRGAPPFRAHFEPGAQPAGAHGLVGVDWLRFALNGSRAQGLGDEVVAHGLVRILDGKTC